MSNKAIVRIFVITAVFFFIIGYLSPIPGDGDDFMGEYPSPNGKYTVELYFDGNNEEEAFSDYAIVRRKNFPHFARNIYREYYNSGNNEVYWIDNHTVYINGYELNIFFDYYGGVDYSWFEK